MCIVFSRLILGACVAVFSVIPLGVESHADSKTQGLIREEDRLGARSDEYSRTFEKAVSALAQGEAEVFRSLLSSATVLNESRGPGAIDAVIKTRFIPYFSDFSELTDDIVTVPTYDAAGNSGIAIARSFVTSDGERRSFVIYLITEKVTASTGNRASNKTHVVVGNLLLDVTGKELLERKTKGEPGGKAK